MIEKLLQQAYPIFVYGTLQPGGGRYDVVMPYVADYGICPATVDGYQLYRFNAFPGEIKEEGAVNLHGTIIILKGDRYVEAIGRLDRYEAEGFLFNRIVVRAKTGSGTIVPCWFYEVRNDVVVVERKRPILSNDWLTK